MLKITIRFNGNANQGSFAIDAIATTLGGNWSEKSSADSSGILTDVDPGTREWVEEILGNDERVESYAITEE